MLQFAIQPYTCLALVQSERGCSGRMDVYCIQRKVHRRHSTNLAAQRKSDNLVAEAYTEQRFSSGVGAAYYLKAATIALSMELFQYSWNTNGERITSQTGSIQGRSSVTLNRDPGITTPSKSAAAAESIAHFRFRKMEKKESGRSSQQDRAGPLRVGSGSHSERA